MVMTLDPELVPRRCDPELRNFARTGGASMTGRQQRVASDAGFWELVLSGFRINTPTKVRAWRAMIARLRQGEKIIIKVFDRNSARGARSEDAYARSAGSAALRATEMSLSVAGMEVEAGAYFSIGTRLHVITEAVSGATDRFFNLVSSDGPWIDDLPWSDADPSVREVDIKFVPPLRASVSAGTEVRFTDLTMRGVLANMNEGDLSLDLLRLGTASLTIRENI